jgi:hypothetical protein
MADLGTTTAPPPPSTTPPDTSSGRRVGRRRSLPGGRAVAGAFLITAAAVGVFASYLNATAEPTTRYVVATTDIPRGTVVSADMLDTVAIELPEMQRSSTVPAGNIDNVIGRVTLGPVRGGDLLQWTTVLSVDPPPGAATMTFSLPTSRVAHRGNLAAGDTVDIVATYGDTTLYVATRVELLSNAVPGDSGISLTIAVDDPQVGLAIANALDQARVYILRSSPDSSAVPPPFRPTTSAGQGQG